LYARRGQHRAALVFAHAINVFGDAAADVCAAARRLRGTDAAGIVRKFQVEKAAAIRNAKDRRRTERVNRRSKPERPNSAQRRPPGTMRHH
jgi:hypothetical protein